MDKCREEFEEYFKEHHADSFYSVDVALEMRGDDYIDFLASDLWAIWQHQQAKVEELKATIKGNHGRIAELERLNRVKAQAIIDLHQEITELKASHHGEVIGHEVHFKKIKQERDELQTLYIQQGINMLKLQKRVEALTQTMEEVLEEMKYPTATFEEVIVCGVKELEQALKGGG
ncbi:hypothetical protein ACEPKG_003881 [Acinetobacter baumannii]